MSARPRLSFNGTCQSHYLAAIFEGAAPDLDVSFVMSETGEARDAADERTLVIEQARPFDESAGRPAWRDPRRIPLPVIMVKFPWPFVGPTPADKARRPHTPVTFANSSVIDSHLVECVAKAATADAAAAEYLSLDIAGLGRVERLKSLNLRQMEAVCAPLDLWTHRTVEEGFTKERMFQMFGHPGRTVMLELFEHLLGAIEAADPAIAAAIDADAARRRIAATDGMQEDKSLTPVHPTVAERLGLEWALRPEALHRAMPPLTNAEFLRTLVRIEFLFRSISFGAQKPEGVVTELTGPHIPDLAAVYALARLAEAGRRDLAEKVLDKRPELIRAAPDRELVKIVMRYQRQKKPAPGLWLLDRRIAAGGDVDQLIAVRERHFAGAGAAKSQAKVTFPRLLRAIDPDDLDGALQALRERSGDIGRLPPGLAVRLVQDFAKARRDADALWLLDAYAEQTDSVSRGLALVRLERVRKALSVRMASGQES